MKKKKLNIKSFFIVLLASYFAIVFVRQQFVAARLNREEAKRIQQLKADKDQEEELREQLELSESNPEGFAERRARERLGYIKENETPIKSLPEGQ
jgi:cell division protein FtsB